MRLEFSCKVPPTARVSNALTIGGTMVFYVNSVLRKEVFHTIFDDVTSADNADECVLIIHHGNKILPAGPLDQIVHTGCDTDGNIVFTPGNLHNAARLCLPHIHIAHIFQCPKQVSFCQRATVFPVLIQDGQGRVAGGFHLFQCLSNGVIVINEGTHGLRCKKK